MIDLVAFYSKCASTIGIVFPGGCSFASSSRSHTARVCTVVMITRRACEESLIYFKVKEVDSRNKIAAKVEETILGTGLVRTSEVYRIACVLGGRKASVAEVEGVVMYKSMRAIVSKTTSRCKVVGLKGTRCMETGEFTVQLSPTPRNYVWETKGVPFKHTETMANAESMRF